MYIYVYAALPYRSICDISMGKGKYLNVFSTWIWQVEYLFVVVIFFSVFKPAGFALFGLADVLHLKEQLSTKRQHSSNSEIMLNYFDIILPGEIAMEI